MSKVTTKPKPHLVGRTRPAEVKDKITASWTEEKREAARVRGNQHKQNQEWLLRIAKSLMGEKNPRWEGGIADGKYAPGFCKTLKLRIRARDKFTCQLCGITEVETGYSLSIHHSDYDKTNHSETNLFAACKRCNSLVNTKREMWKAYFADIAEERGL